MSYFPHIGGDLNCPSPPGLLPKGLRIVLLNDTDNHSLQPGSLPSTLAFLQLGFAFDQPIAQVCYPPLCATCLWKGRWSAIISCCCRRCLRR